MPTNADLNYRPTSIAIGTPAELAIFCRAHGLKVEEQEEVAAAGRTRDNKQRYVYAITTTMGDEREASLAAETAVAGTADEQGVGQGGQAEAV